ncbi:secreted RxLR effector protein 161-like [Schistocerca piceifrons]|uniref:secreted RxLR effector protein 161-like n=1 Tax=Schistocerca piceifrons TaxID=274613 RepID=UPI001F5FE31C|nr:secreted RxLR effector protein 161-like [Schistocerca piceifrons]
MKNIHCHEAMGSLMYVRLGTRSDLTSPIGIVSRFCNNPGILHWQAVQRIFRYLKGAVMSWQCKKQATVAFSTTEAQCMALTSACQDALWFQRLRNEMSPDPKKDPVKLLCDKKAD